MSENIKQNGTETDIVISSRVRMARNIESLSFPHHLNKDKAAEIIDKIQSTIINSNSSFKDEFILIKIGEIDKIERTNYIEKHLISPALARNTTNGAFLINKEETISIMINEEDHIRIQCLYPGLQLDKCLQIADQIDDLLEDNIKYAFDEDLGYLTCCPTNVGTGLRASVMLHLPALSLTGYINGIIRTTSKIGLTFRGIYGEGSQYLGDIYQVSNQVTLGVSEEEIVSSLQNIISKIVSNERAARTKLLNSKSIDLEDKVFRSYGTLKYARLLTSKEAMQLISDVKLGISLNLIKNATINKLNELIAMIQPGHLQKYFKSQLTEKERDIKRAELLRENIQ